MIINPLFLGLNLISSIELVGTSSASSSNTTLVINKPSGVQQNDLLIAVMIAGDDATVKTWTGDTGWTERIDTGIRVATKVATASEGASYTFTSSSSTTASNGAIVALRNAAWDTIGSMATGSSTPVTANAITVAENGSYLFAAFGVLSSASRTFSSPSSGLVSIYTPSSKAALGFYYDDNYSSGSSGTKSASYSGAGGQQNTYGVLFSAKPA